MASNLNFRLKLVKFQLYPSDEPDSYAIGFDVTVENGQSFYQDTLVPLEETSNLTDDEIITLAWENVKDSVLNRVEKISRVSPFLGKGWTPPEMREHEGEPIVGIEEFDNMTVNLGTSEDELDLPNQVNTQLEDGRTAIVGIDWNTFNYEGGVEGENFLEGSLIDLPSTVSNPHEIKAGITIIVKELSEFNLTISTEGEGGTKPEEGSYSYLEKTEVNLVASPSKLFMLDEWTGDIHSTSKETQVVMDSNKSVMAVFIEKYTVSSVEDSESLSVKYGTEFEELNLPEEINFILADEWEVGVNYVVGDIVSYNNKYYEVLQEHTSQSDWTPDTAHSLYEEIASNEKTDRNIEVSWLSGNYDKNTSGTYTLEAAPILPGDIANPDEIIATIDVTVEEEQQV